MKTSALNATLLRAALPIALALSAAGCKPAQAPGHGGFPPALVAVVAIEPKDVPVTYEYMVAAPARSWKARSRAPRSRASRRRR